MLSMSDKTNLVKTNFVSEYLRANPPSRQLDFLLSNLDLPSATNDPDARWEAYQFAFFNNTNTLTIDNKSRQVGWSWSAAADAVARSMLVPRSTSIFVSINQEEASEKIRYAKQIIEALEPSERPLLLVDNRLELEFGNGSRLISHPCRPVRGKARATVYLDEFAHYPKDREIYTSALPVVTRGGTIRIGSSPLGETGMFWEISEQRINPYPGYVRRSIQWWSIRALCKDVTAAATIAPHMLTAERVATFGTQRLREIFENMLLEDFQQEYECLFSAERESWISWDEIKANQMLAQAGMLWYRQADDVNTAIRLVEDVRDAIASGEIEPVLAGGMDIGRKRNLTEIVFLGKTTTGHAPYRFGISLTNVKFEDQFAVAERCLTYLPVSLFLIDQNGLGMQLAEQLNGAFGQKAQGIVFDNPNKEMWAVELKVQMQKANVPLPLDRQLSYQIHSIKKMQTAAKNAVFDTQRNEKAHADKFWALALALWAIKGAEATRNMRVVVV